MIGTRALCEQMAQELLSSGADSIKADIYGSTSLQMTNSISLLLWIRSALEPLSTEKHALFPSAFCAHRVQY